MPMSASASLRAGAHLVDLGKAETVEIMGPLVQFLTAPANDDGAPCTMRGTIPPGVVVPLHSHADPETYLVVSGEAEALVEKANGLEWIRLGPGDVFDVPGDAKHAFRNPTRHPAVMIIVSTAKIGRFFQEIGTPFVPGARSAGPPSDATIRHFLQTAERYGYWNATPAENAQAGIAMPEAAKDAADPAAR
jgi:quercetin dioxygenase-like cupin family protein